MRQDIRSFRVDRITGLQRTGAAFVRPDGFSARDFLLQRLLPAPEQDSELTAVVIESDEAVLNDLCSHWLFGHTLVRRSTGSARFLLDQAAIDSFAPYFLLPYGKSLVIVEPASLEHKLSIIAADLAEYYQES